MPYYQNLMSRRNNPKRILYRSKSPTQGKIECRLSSTSSVQPYRSDEAESIIRRIASDLLHANVTLSHRVRVRVRVDSAAERPEPPRFKSESESGGWVAGAPNRNGCASQERPTSLFVRVCYFERIQKYLVLWFRNSFRTWPRAGSP